jgi:hypothetical protein
MDQAVASCAARTVINQCTTTRNVPTAAARTSNTTAPFRAIAHADRHDDAIIVGLDIGTMARPDCETFSATINGLGRDPLSDLLPRETPTLDQDHVVELETFSCPDGRLTECKVAAADISTVIAWWIRSDPLTG